MGRLLDENIESNFGDSRDRCRAVPLCWSSEAAEKLLADIGTSFDLVLCSDCINEGVYGQSWKPLADCLEVLCKSSETTAVMSVTRRGLNDGVEGFLVQVGEALSVEKLNAKLVNDQTIEVYSLTQKKQVSDLD